MLENDDWVTQQVGNVNFFSSFDDVWVFLEERPTNVAKE